jgi:hypothetical protein
MTQQHNALIPARWSIHRRKDGTPAVVDGAASNTFPNRRSLLGCDGYTTINALVLLEGGSTPTVDLEALAYDPDQDATPSGDAFAVIDSATGMTDQEVARITVHRNRVFLRIAAVTGDPTSIEVRVGPAEAAPWPQR